MPEKNYKTHLNTKTVKLFKMSGLTMRADFYRENKYSC